MAADSCQAVLCVDAHQTEQPYPLANRKAKIMKKYASILVAVLATALISGCSPKEESPLKISLHMWAGYEPIFMADREGWLDKNKVQIVESHSAADSISALKNKTVDAAGLTFDEVLRARAEGVPISVVMVCDISAGADVVLAKAEIKSIAELKGKRIAVEQGALGALMLYKTLEVAGLTPKDVTQVNLAPMDQLEPWNSNKIDAVVSYEPTSMAIEKTGANRLIDSRKIPDTIFDVFVVRTDVLKEKPNAVKHLLETQQKGLDFFHSNPQDTAYRMSEHLALPPEEVLASFKGLTLPDRENNQRLLGGENPVLVSIADDLSKILIAAELLQKPDNKIDLVNDDFLPH
jgi:NitT/TauT family transport system substrate-binding protein